MKKQYEAPFLGCEALMAADILTLSIFLFNDEESERQFDYRSILQGKYS